MNTAPSGVGPHMSKPAASWQRTVVDQATLSMCMPPKLRRHANAQAFLEKIDAAAQQAVDTRAHFAPGEVRSALADLAGAAKTFRNALGALRDNPEVERALRLHMGYLMASKEQLQRGELEEPKPLVDRLRNDVDTLEKGCASTVKSLMVVGTTQPGKQAARHLTDRAAKAYRTCFDEPAPQRSWFANVFMPELGRQLGIVIGTEIVRETVKRLKEHG